MAQQAERRSSTRSIIKNKRCLVPADGFYEWEKKGGRKQPHYFGVKDFRPFAFAGLWQVWNKGDEPLLSCVILTTDANEMLAKIHNRMPVIVLRRLAKPGHARASRARILVRAVSSV